MSSEHHPFDFFNLQCCNEPMEKQQASQDLEVVVNDLITPLDKLRGFLTAVLARQVESINRIDADQIKDLSSKLGELSTLAAQASEDIRRYQTQPGSVTNSYF